MFKWKNNVGSATAALSTSVGTGGTTALGDFLIVMIDQGGGVVTPPAGWTLIGAANNGSNAVVFWKIAGASEPSSYTFSWASSGTFDWAIASWSGVSGTPIDRSSQTTGTSFGPYVASSVTPIGATDLLLCLWDVEWGGTYTPPAGMTTRVSVSGAGNTYLGISELQLASNAATATESTAGPGTRNAIFWTTTIALAPAGAVQAATPFVPTMRQYMRAGATGGGGQAPVVTPATFTNAMPATLNEVIGTVGFTGGTPTSWAITAGNTAGYFAISNAGVITVTSAGAAGITATTYNLTCQATNAVGSNSGAINVTMTATQSADGSAGAPAGTPQYAGLLNGYVARPPWNVAGVDYHVGIDRTLYPTNASLKAPSTATLPAGVTRNISNHTFSLSGNGAVVDGFDFSLDGGWMASIDGANCTISNCNFKVGSNNSTTAAVSNSATNALIKNCEITSIGSTQQIMVGLNGTVTMMYNLMTHCWGQNIVFASQTGHGGENVVLKFNVIADAGEGFNQGAHGDWIQAYNANGVNTNSFTCNYNLWLQTDQIANGPRTQGISAFSANSGPASGGCQTEDYENNTFIGEAGAYVNYAVIIDTTRLIGSAILKNNYFDLTGIGQAPYGGAAWFIGDYSGGNGGPYNGTVTVSGNINMKTGGAIT